MNASDAERAEWSDVQGDYWHRRWSRTSGTSVLSDPVMEIRSGAGREARLVASTVIARQVDGVAKIDLTGTDLTAGILDWVIDAANSSLIPVSSQYVLEVEVLRDGKEATIMSHPWQVLSQTAVRP